MRNYSDPDQAFGPKKISQVKRPDPSQGRLTLLALVLALGLVLPLFPISPDFVGAINDCGSTAFARSSAHKSSKSSGAAKSTKSTRSSRSAGSAKSGRSSRVSTSSSSRRSHGHSVASSRSAISLHGTRSRHGARSVETASAGGRHGRHGRVYGHAVAGTVSGRRHHKFGVNPDEPKTAKSDVNKEDAALEAQAATEAQPRQRNYSLLASAYSLYDQGVNERLKGNYGLSTDKLSEAAKLIDQASSIGRDGRASTLAATVFFELGQSAEADGDLKLARDSYYHAVRAKPDYVEGYLRLVNVLATTGRLREALNYLKDGLREVPHDPRLNAMLTQLATFMGEDPGKLDGGSVSQGAPEPDASDDSASRPTVVPPISAPSPDLARGPKAAPGEDEKSKVSDPDPGADAPSNK